MKNFETDVTATVALNVIKKGGVVVMFDRFYTMLNDGQIAYADYAPANFKPSNLTAEGFTEIRGLFKVAAV